MSYATPAQLLQRYDARTVGDLVSDDGNQVSAGDLLADANLQAALNDASGQIESALLQAERYSVADLTALVGSSSNTKYVLIRLTCDIAFQQLVERRPWYEVNESYKQRTEDADETLERLRKGERVFDLSPVKEAGLPVADTPTRASIEQLNLTVDAARRGYYPARRMPRQAEG